MSYFFGSSSASGASQNESDSKNRNKSESDSKKEDEKNDQKVSAFRARPLGRTFGNSVMSPGMSWSQMLRSDVLEKGGSPTTQPPGYDELMASRLSEREVERNYEKDSDGDDLNRNDLNKNNADDSSKIHSPIDSPSGSQLTNSRPSSVAWPGAGEFQMEESRRGKRAKVQAEVGIKASQGRSQKEQEMTGWFSFGGSAANKEGNTNRDSEGRDLRAVRQSSGYQRKTERISNQARTFDRILEGGTGSEREDEGGNVNEEIYENHNGQNDKDNNDGNKLEHSDVENLNEKDAQSGSLWGWGWGSDSGGGAAAKDTAEQLVQAGAGSGSEAGSSQTDSISSISNSVSEFATSDDEIRESYGRIAVEEKIYPDTTIEGRMITAQQEVNDANERELRRIKKAVVNETYQATEAKYDRMVKQNIEARELAPAGMSTSGKKSARLKGMARGISGILGTGFRSGGEDDGPGSSISLRHDETFATGREPRLSPEERAAELLGGSGTTELEGILAQPVAPGSWWFHQGGAGAGYNAGGDINQNIDRNLTLRSQPFSSQPFTGSAGAGQSSLQLGSSTSSPQRQIPLNRSADRRLLPRDNQSTNNVSESEDSDTSPKPLFLGHQQIFSDNPNLPSNQNLTAPIVLRHGKTRPITKTYDEAQTIKIQNARKQARIEREREEKMTRGSKSSSASKHHHGKSDSKRSSSPSRESSKKLYLGSRTGEDVIAPTSRDAVELDRMSSRGRREMLLRNYREDVERMAREQERETDLDHGGSTTDQGNVNFNLKDSSEEEEGKLQDPEHGFLEDLAEQVQTAVTATVTTVTATVRKIQVGEVGETEEGDAAEAKEVTPLEAAEAAAEELEAAADPADSSPQPAASTEPAEQATQINTASSQDQAAAGVTSPAQGDSITTGSPTTGTHITNFFGSTASSISNLIFGDPEAEEKARQAAFTREMAKRKLEIERRKKMFHEQKKQHHEENAMAAYIDGSAHLTDRIIDNFMQTPVGLSVLVHKAVGLPATDEKYSFTGLAFGQKMEGTRSDPYVTISLIRGDPRPRQGRYEICSEPTRTETVPNSQEPQWEEIVEIDLDEHVRRPWDASDCFFHCQVWDENILHDEKVGQCIVPASEIFQMCGSKHLRLKNVLGAGKKGRSGGGAGGMGIAGAGGSSGSSKISKEMAKYYGESKGTSSSSKRSGGSKKKKKKKRKSRRGSANDDRGRSVNDNDPSSSSATNPADAAANRNDNPTEASAAVLSSSPPITKQTVASELLERKLAKKKIISKKKQFYTQTKDLRMRIRFETVLLGDQGNAGGERVAGGEEHDPNALKFNHLKDAPADKQPLTLKIHAHYILGVSPHQLKGLLEFRIVKGDPSRQTRVQVLATTHTYAHFCDSKRRCLIDEHLELKLGGPGSPIQQKAFLKPDVNVQLIFYSSNHPNLEFAVGQWSMSLFKLLRYNGCRPFKLDPVFSTTVVEGMPGVVTDEIQNLHVSGAVGESDDGSAAAGTGGANADGASPQPTGSSPNATPSTLRTADGRLPRRSSQSVGTKPLTPVVVPAVAAKPMVPLAVATGLLTDSVLFMGFYGEGSIQEILPDYENMTQDVVSVTAERVEEYKKELEKEQRKEQRKEEKKKRKMERRKEEKEQRREERRLRGEDTDSESEDSEVSEVSSSDSSGEDDSSESDSWSDSQSSKEDFLLRDAGGEDDDDLKEMFGSNADDGGDDGNSDDSHSLNTNSDDSPSESPLEAASSVDESSSVDSFDEPITEAFIEPKTFDGGTLAPLQCEIFGASCLPGVFSKKATRKALKIDSGSKSSRKSNSGVSAFEKPSLYTELTPLSDTGQGKLQLARSITSELNEGGDDNGGTSSSLVGKFQSQMAARKMLQQLIACHQNDLSTCVREYVEKRVLDRLPDESSNKRSGNADITPTDDVTPDDSGLFGFFGFGGGGEETNTDPNLMKLLEQVEDIEHKLAVCRKVSLALAKGDGGIGDGIGGGISSSSAAAGGSGSASSDKSNSNDYALPAGKPDFTWGGEALFLKHIPIEDDSLKLRLRIIHFYQRGRAATGMLGSNDDEFNNHIMGASVGDIGTHHVAACENIYCHEEIARVDVDIRYAFELACLRPWRGFVGIPIPRREIVRVKKEREETHQKTVDKILKKEGGMQSLLESAGHHGSGNASNIDGSYNAGQAVMQRLVKEVWPQAERNMMSDKRTKHTNLSTFLSGFQALEGGEAQGIQMGSGAGNAGNSGSGLANLSSSTIGFDGLKLRNPMQVNDKDDDSDVASESDAGAAEIGRESDGVGMASTTFTSAEGKKPIMTRFLDQIELFMRVKNVDGNGIELQIVSVSGMREEVFLKRKVELQVEVRLLSKHFPKMKKLDENTNSSTQTSETQSSYPNHQQRNVRQRLVVLSKEIRRIRKLQKNADTNIRTQYFSGRLSQLQDEYENFNPASYVVAFPNTNFMQSSEVTFAPDFSYAPAVDEYLFFPELWEELRGQHLELQQELQQEAEDARNGVSGSPSPSAAAKTSSGGLSSLLGGKGSTSNLPPPPPPKVLPPLPPKGDALILETEKTGFVKPAADPHHPGSGVWLFLEDVRLDFGEAAEKMGLGADELFPLGEDEADSGNNADTDNLNRSGRGTSRRWKSSSPNKNNSSKISKSQLASTVSNLKHLLTPSLQQCCLRSLRSVHVVIWGRDPSNAGFFSSADAEPLCQMEIDLGQIFRMKGILPVEMGGRKFDASLPPIVKPAIINMQTPSRKERRRRSRNEGRRRRRSGSGSEEDSDDEEDDDEEDYDDDDDDGGGDSIDESEDSESADEISDRGIRRRRGRKSRGGGKIRGGGSRQGRGDWKMRGGGENKGEAKRKGKREVEEVKRLAEKGANSPGGVRHQETKQVSLFEASHQQGHPHIDGSAGASGSASVTEETSQDENETSEEYSGEFNGETQETENSISHSGDASDSSNESISGMKRNVNRNVGANHNVKRSNRREVTVSNGNLNSSRNITHRQFKLRGGGENRRISFDEESDVEFSDDGGSGGDSFRDEHSSRNDDERNDDSDNDDGDDPDDPDSANANDSADEDYADYRRGRTPTRNYDTRDGDYNQNNVGRGSSGRKRSRSRNRSRSGSRKRLSGGSRRRSNKILVSDLSPKQIRKQNELLRDTCTMKTNALEQAFVSSFPTLVSERYVPPCLFLRIEALGGIGSISSTTSGAGSGAASGGPLSDLPFLSGPSSLTGPNEPTPNYPELPHVIIGCQVKKAKAIPGADDGYLFAGGGVDRGIGQGVISPFVRCSIVRGNPLKALEEGQDPTQIEPGYGRPGKATYDKSGTLNPVWNQRIELGPVKSGEKKLFVYLVLHDKNTLFGDEILGHCAVSFHEILSLRGVRGRPLKALGNSPSGTSSIPMSLGIGSGPLGGASADSQPDPVLFLQFEKIQRTENDTIVLQLKVIRAENLPYVDVIGGGIAESAGSSPSSSHSGDGNNADGSGDLPFFSPANHVILTQVTLVKGGNPITALNRGGAESGRKKKSSAGFAGGGATVQVNETSGGPDGGPSVQALADHEQALQTKLMEILEKNVMILNNSRRDPEHSSGGGWFPSFFGGDSSGSPFGSGTTKAVQCTTALRYTRHPIWEESIKLECNDDAATEDIWLHVCVGVMRRKEQSRGFFGFGKSGNDSDDEGSGSRSGASSMGEPLKANDLSGTFEPIAQMSCTISSIFTHFGLKPMQIKPVETYSGTAKDVSKTKLFVGFDVKKG